MTKGKTVNLPPIDPKTAQEQREQVRRLRRAAPEVQAVYRIIDAWIPDWSLDLFPDSEGSPREIMWHHALSKRPWPPSEAGDFLQKLGHQGIPVDRIVAILSHALPPYRTWRYFPRRLSLVHPMRKELLEKRGIRGLSNPSPDYTEKIHKLRSRYRRLNQILEKDSALSHAFKSTWQKEYRLIDQALRRLEEPIRKDPLKPHGDFTVGMNVELSRQRFWTGIITRLVPLWKKAGLSKYRAFDDIARLLSLAFPPFPGNPSLVKRRYYHAAKKQNR